MNAQESDFMVSGIAGAARRRARNVLWFLGLMASEAGEYGTTLKNLADECCLTINEIRLTLEHLKIFNEIKISRISHGLIIQLVNVPPRPRMVSAPNFTDYSAQVAAELAAEREQAQALSASDENDLSWAEAAMREGA